MYRLKYVFLTLSVLLSFSSAYGDEYIPDVSPETVSENGFDGLILDVRSTEEFAAGHVPAAVNLPHTELASHLATLGPINQPILVYCRSGRRASLALAELQKLGFRSLFHLNGDMLEWKARKLPLVP